MCVLILQYRLLPGAPILVGANRDEAYARPSAPPELADDGRVLAPVDLRAGGTWLGVNGDGLVVALTNRDREPADRRRATRGELCREALAAPTTAEAVRRVAGAVERSPRNAFQLLVADPEEAMLIVGDATIRVQPVEPGTHVLTNRHALDAFDIGPIAVGATVGDALAQLRERCRDHTDRGGYQICKHGVQGGTVSSAIIAVHDARVIHFEFADGPPCTTPWTEVVTTGLRRSAPARAPKG